MKRRRLVPLDLAQGEEHCADCDGTGGLPNDRKCKKCKGTGKLNWFEKILGKDQVVHKPETLTECSRLNRQKRYKEDSNET